MHCRRIRVLHAQPSYRLDTEVCRIVPTQRINVRRALMTAASVLCFDSPGNRCQKLTSAHASFRLHLAMAKDLLLGDKKWLQGVTSAQERRHTRMRIRKRVRVQIDTHAGVAACTYALHEVLGTLHAT